ncbi:MAG: NAD(P)H-hydrate dehydratase [Verrucomicrobiales bacterium]
MIPAVSPAEMRALEDELFASGVDPAELMAVAARELSAAIFRHCPLAVGRAVLFAGKGHNAGDGYLCLRELAERGWEIFEALACDPDELKPLTAAARASCQPAQWSTDLADDERPLLVLDGLLGIGASGAPRGAVRDAIAEMNGIRARKRQTYLVAIDAPTGLDAGTGEVPAEAVKAHLSVTFGRAKHGLLMEKAAPWVGRLTRVPLPGIACDEVLVTGRAVGRFLPKRDPSWHKGTAGRVSIIAGSPGYLGAAQLCAEAALRAGAGLVTLWCDEVTYPLLASRLRPEIMVRVLDQAEELREFRCDAFVIGPGLGARCDALFPWYREEERPVVADADFLSYLSRQAVSDWPAKGPRIWTPHPGEAARFFPEDEEVSPESHQSRLSRQARATILWKGARTRIVEEASGTCFVNSSGHPGMASAGMGDVLAGVIAALRAQGLADPQAAASAAWLCGRAAELACHPGAESWESCTASDVCHSLGATYRSLP